MMPSLHEQDNDEPVVALPSDSHMASATADACEVDLETNLPLRSISIDTQPNITSTDAHSLGSGACVPESEHSMSMYAVERKPSMQVEKADDAPDIARQALALGMALMAPLLVAFCPVGVTWVNMRSSAPFSFVSALACASVSAVVILVTTLASAHGGGAVRALFSRKYAGIVISGVLCGAFYWLQIMALSSIGPTLLSVVMKSNMLFGAIFQCLVLKQRPNTDQTVSIFIVVGIGVSFTLSSTGDNDELHGSVLGILAAFAAACVDAMCYFSFEIGARNCSDVRGEGLRRAVFYQAGSLLIYLPLLMIFDSELVIEQGVFSGWSYETILFVVLPISVRGVVFPCVIAHCGALKAQLVSTLDVVFAYTLEVTFLQTVSLRSTSIVLLGTLVLATANARRRMSTCSMRSSTSTSCSHLPAADV